MGTTEALMLANGFSVELIVELAREGLATERIVGGGEVAWVRITERGGRRWRR
jgi:hypothetical protein